MNINEVKQAKTAGEARQYAIEWQGWVSEQNLSYGEIKEWQAVFVRLAEKYPELEEEFSVNGII